MSARFVVNFVVLMLGAALVVVLYAFSRTTTDAVAIGVGSGAILAALHNFALPHQGSYQRCADGVICVVGAWTIVAARALSYQGRWLEFGAGMALVALGSLGLLLRELSLHRGMQVGAARIGPDQFVRISSLQREAGVRS